MINDFIYNDINSVLIDYENNKDIVEKRSELDLITYYKVGRLITDAILKYGDDIVSEYAEKLKEDVDKKYTEINLKRYRYFYLLIENGALFSFDLKWSHYVELLHLSPKKANYYIYLVTHNNLSIRELRTRIKNKEYDRLYDNLNSDLNNGKRISGDTCIKDVIKNPLFVRNSVSENKLPEFEIHNLILDDIKEFSSKLNTSYSIIGIEYDVLFNTNKYNIDLLLYSVKYNCYIVVLLKSGSFKSDYIFQVDNYMEYVDDNIRLVSENKSIGIVVLRKDNKDIISYCTDYRVLIREDNII